MLEKAYLLCGLAAAMTYAIGASSMKAAGDRGMRSLQTSLAANIAVAVAFLAFVPWTNPPLLPSVWWPSLVVGGLFFLGQLFTILALRRGHASIATPALGSKVVMVALILGFGFAKPLGLNVWIAAAMTTLGIAILAWPSEHLPLSRVVPAVGYSVISAAAFGMFDVLTQLWSPWLTFGRLMPPSMLIAAAISAVVIVAIDRRPPRVPAGAGRWLALGAGLFAGQSMLLIWSIGRFQDVAGLNVVYGSRGIWSVLVVWLIGHHFSTDERMTSRGMLARRLLAAAMIAGAIWLVVAK